MFADVILPLPFSDLYTYTVPVEMQDKIAKGFRVIVPFGTRKHYTAIVKSIHNNVPKNFKTKEIHSLVDSNAVVNDIQFKLWEWISFYYMCPIGDVYNAAMPSSMKSDNIKSKFIPKTETYLKINTNIDTDLIIEIIGKAKKQQSLFKQLYNYFQEKDINKISKSDLSNFPNYSPSVLNGLLQKEILQAFDLEVSRINNEVKPLREPYPLSEAQSKSFENIINLFKVKSTCLLHGVTSSGKTEIYIHLIEHFKKQNKQTLYLLPEIALTSQLEQRLIAVYGSKIGVYHSKINDNQRAEIWRKMLSNEPYEIIVGVRSSLFLPFKNLGLVIVDEEHETSYKQNDPAPRYHARDTAIMLAHLFNAKTVLGSATPSLESYNNTVIGKYGIINLKNRYNNILMPDIRIENTYELIKRKKMKTVLSPALNTSMQQALDEGEQVILFRNRRGFSSLIECKQCAWNPKCNKCDVTLTYHKMRNRLVCHYCNTSYKVPSICPACNSETLESLGKGTEQLEEEVKKLFPDYIVGRMDMDTTRGKDSYDKIIDKFQKKRIDILVGTQMLSKGLDFENVGIVGIISADSLLNYPDFRSHERGFQLMMQAAGRAGRNKKQGKVIIQSSDPSQPIYNYILNYNYERFYNEQILERKLFRYPPFTRLISIVFKDKNENKVEKGSNRFASMIKPSLGHMVLGPNKPVISRIQQYNIREILLKLDIDMSTSKIRGFLKQVEVQLREDYEFKYLHIYYDVDKM